jgi:hypothetical protein
LNVPRIQHRDGEDSFEELAAEAENNQSMGVNREDAGDFEEQPREMEGVVVPRTGETQDGPMQIDDEEDVSYIPQHPVYN